ncbi:alpha/beta fold hydrolase [Novosphingobium sp. M1R2S20]|uniref:Alpha/beta fold hydrolase n=1 Tax=Novosphingobium rhizovicinum TaxID=3228928 RepID=A0ABV3R6Q8_9SPHN
MATFVLIHGGGHGGWCYGEVSPLLRDAGHMIHAPSLTGCGDRKHTVTSSTDLDTHITDVVNLMEFEDLSEVILVGHSYGGMVITGVADRVPARIRELVFLDASHPTDGVSLRMNAPHRIEPAYAGMRVVDGVELVLFPQPGWAAFFGIRDPDDVAWAEPRFTPHPWKCFDQPLLLHNGDAAFKLPRTNINCTETLRDSPEDMRRRQLDGHRNFEIDTGHDLMITEPGKVAEMLLSVAA